MKKVLVTGGSVFVSKYVVKYYVEKGNDVFVLNRNNREQIKCVTYIEGDRHFIGDKLKEHHFDVIFDMTAYTEEDINGLLDGLGNFD